MILLHTNLNIRVLHSELYVNHNHRIETSLNKPFNK